MISVSNNLSELGSDKSEENIRQKLNKIQEACSDLFSDYESSFNVQEKKKILKELLGFQKLFQKLVAEIPDEDIFLLEISSMQISFTKVDAEVMKFGYDEILKSNTEHRPRGEEQKDVLRDAVRRNSNMSDAAFEEYREEMNKYEHKKDEFETLPEEAKHEKVNEMLEKLKVSSGFSLPHTSDFLKTSEFSLRRKSNISDFIFVQNEIKLADETLKKEKCPQKRAAIQQKQEDLKNLSKMMMGLRSIYEVLFTSRNPIVRLFMKMFGKTPKPEKRATASITIE